MKEFDILRYLRKFSVWILLLAVVGAAGIYYYGKSNQHYTATISIEYTNSAASEGLTPNGTEINTSEIFSSAVVSAALEDLQLSANVDAVRSRVSVTEVIPEEQQEINEALIKEGEEVTYIPTVYKVTYTADGSESAEYARDMLDAIIKNYCIFYSEKYIEQSVLPNGTEDLSEHAYDYLNYASMLESITEDMLDYLEDKRFSYPDFRASSTGYSFSDLVDIYSRFLNYEVPKFYAMVLSGVPSEDRDVLISSLKTQIADYERQISNNGTELEYMDSLIDNLIEQSSEILKNQFGEVGTGEDGELLGSAASNYIIKDVEGSSGVDLSIYDSLIDDYVELRSSQECARIKKEHAEYLLEEVSSGSIGSYSEEELDTFLSSFVENLNQYYQIVSETGTELNSYLSAENLDMLSSVTVKSAINIKLYILLALIFFMIVGVIGAIVIGRAEDFIEYFVYIDPHVNLPNRKKCDEYIDNRAEALLKEDFACIFIKLTNLTTVTETFGRNEANRLLGDFGSILKGFADAYGFVGYNNAGQFIAFFEGCNGNKAQAIFSVFERSVKEYNSRSTGVLMEYTIGIAVSTDDNCYAVRDLLRLAIDRCLHRGTFEKEKAVEPEDQTDRGEAADAKDVKDVKDAAPEDVHGDAASEAVSQKADTDTLPEPDSVSISAGETKEVKQKTEKKNTQKVSTQKRRKKKKRW